MNKNVFIIRHAKTENAMTVDKRDYERVLTPRGKNDARLVAERLEGKSWKPDLIIASTAYRAANTAAIIASQLDYNASDIQWESSLYLCNPEQIEIVIKQIKDTTIQTVFVVAHNMGVTEYVNEKIDSFFIDNVPTAGIVGFELPISGWSQNSKQLQGKLIYWDYPKLT